MQMDEQQTTERDLNEVLAKRAEELAREKDDTALVDTSTILAFSLGTEEVYALPYQDVFKVCNMVPITPVPAIHPIFLGLVYLNAEVWPVVELNKLLNLKQNDDYEMLILLKQQQTRIALAISEIKGLVQYDGDVTLTHESKDAEEGLIKGIYRSEIAIVNNDKLFQKMVDYTINDLT